VHGNPVEPTEMGMKMAEALQEYAPRIASPEMTAQLERDMDLISERDLTKEQVVTTSRDLLRQAYGLLEENRQQMATKIYEGITDDRILGDCPKCGTHRIRIIRSKASKKRFVGCEGYPECDQTYPLPQRGDVISTGEICPQCGSPKVKILGGRRPWILCLDPHCPTKAEYQEKRAARALKAAAAGEGDGETTAKAKKTTAKKPAAKKRATATKATATKTAAAKKPAATKKTTTAKATTAKKPAATATRSRAKAPAAATDDTEA
jgi:DNA topoisomerase-1